MVCQGASGWWTRGLLAGVVLGLGAGLGAAAGALAPERAAPPVRTGTPEASPAIEVLTQPTPAVTWLVSVRLTAPGSGRVRRAAVRIVPSMSEPHAMVLPAVPLDESLDVPGLYSGPVTFPHPARWTLEVQATTTTGTTTRRLDLNVGAAPAAADDGGRPAGRALWLAIPALIGAAVLWARWRTGRGRGPGT
jgi:hypothetical protein